MKTVIWVLGILLGLLLVLGAVGAFIIPREKLMSYVVPDVKYVTVTNAVITKTYADMDVQLEVTSKLLPVYIDSIVYDFRLFDSLIAQGNQKFMPTSKIGKIQKLSIPVSVDHNKVRELVKRQIAEGEKTQAHVEAYCRLPLVGIRRFDINREVDITLPIVPGANLAPLQPSSGKKE
ncbi:MAG: hypothetical protein COW65_14815 [Cytophagales bacterium CG18_big_fil_WC_8_21_14_2_50_42_9]|nr:MAG: hypothetical protein COW65_14815 [Cytophagales bacterium CG18_big_fil_WC_8_21_14_2_50_42_9]